MPETTTDRSLRWYSAKEPIIIVLLSMLAVVFFLGVTGLSRMFHARQNSIANDFYARGSSDLQAGRLDHATSEFRAALLYSRDNFSYQLSLARALVRHGRLDEAKAYLVNLRQREPENGPVNLELARIFAAKGETIEAGRYYHNAVYAVWEGVPDEQRRAVRLELIEFLLRTNLKPQADAELIALSASLPDDAQLRSQVGDLFMQAQDNEHALSEFRQSLKIDKHDVRAMAGAGRAAFELARYPQAQRLLQDAVTANPDDAANRDLLQTANLVLQMDPFRRQLSASRRNQAVIEAFDHAGERLQACDAKSGSATEPQDSLNAKWNEMKDQVNTRNLTRNPDLLNSVMDLVFSIEQKTSAECGTPTGKDLALLLIARLHEGS